ncbi:hypothetical protein PLANPX_1329 [Lacipirellula parvula]|uniref:Uncharacterized protein n=1 Tax=Lacipirellula parvula TaxID=2650471 RepID=A0A5K7X7A1_9BACT|nr:hypothetical protein PLANPX_1329 [Lacipirellula parvula]
MSAETGYETFVAFVAGCSGGSLTRGYLFLVSLLVAVHVELR